MASIILKSDLIHVEVDSQSGTCIRLSDPEDAWNTNWIDPCGNWGEADVFSHVETIFENGIAVTRSVNVKERLELVLERSGTGTTKTLFAVCSIREKTTVRITVPEGTRSVTDAFTKKNVAVVNGAVTVDFDPLGVAILMINQ